MALEFNQDYAPHTNKLNDLDPPAFEKAESRTAFWVMLFFAAFLFALGVAFAYITQVSMTLKALMFIPFVAIVVILCFIHRDIKNASLK